ncbi:MAG: hypothetical protein AB7O32_00260 [Vicinamibacterales bacterium]
MPPGTPIPGGPGATPPPPPPPGAENVRILVDEDGYHRVDTDGFVLTAPSEDQGGPRGCCCDDAPCDKAWYPYDPCPRDNQHLDCPDRQAPSEPVYLRCDTPCPSPGLCGVAAGVTLPAGIRHRAPGGIRWCYQLNTEQGFFDPADPPEDTTGLLPLPPGAIRVLEIERCTTGCTNTCCACHAYYCGQKCACDQSTRPTTCVEGWRYFQIDDDPAARCITGDCTDFAGAQGYDKLPPGAVLLSGVLTPDPCCENCRQGEARCPDCSHAAGVFEFEDAKPCWQDGHTTTLRYSCCCSHEDTFVEYSYESVVTWVPTCQQFATRSTARGRATIRAGEFGTMDVRQIVERPNGTIDEYHYVVSLFPGCAPIANVEQLKVGTDGIHPFILSSAVRGVQADCSVAVMTIDLVGCPQEDGTPGICTGSTLHTVLAATHSSGARTLACRGSCGDYTDQQRPGSSAPQGAIDILRTLAA